MNAIEPAGSLIHTLKRFREELEAESPPNAEHFPEVPFVALNIGTISGGTAPNIIPDRCEVACSMRLMPGMDTPSMIQRVRDTIADALGESQYEFVVVNETPPLLVDDQSGIYRLLTEQVGQTSTFSASYATDAGWLQTLGMDCAVFGPGSIEAAHRPNESLPIAEFAACESVLERTISGCCSSPQ
jgi:acetylornithine deacetylase